MSTETNTDHIDDSEHRLPLDAAGEITLSVVEVLTGRGFITGKSGSGKSNSASVIVLEARMFKEHPAEASTHVFYGNGDGE